MNVIFKKYPIIDLTTDQKKFIKLFNSDKNINFELINCQLCNSKNYKILFLNDQYGFNQKTVMCKNCGFIFSNPRMDEKSVKYLYESGLYVNIYSTKDNNNFLETKIEGLENFIFFKPKKPDFENYSDNLHFNFICSKNLEFKSVCDIGAGSGAKLMNFKVNSQDVLDKEDTKKFLSDCNNQIQEQGRIIARMSGTEPYLRVMIECNEQNKLNELSDSINHHFSKL